MMSKCCPRHTIANPPDKQFKLQTPKTMYGSDLNIREQSLHTCGTKEKRKITCNITHENIMPSILGKHKTLNLCMKAR